MKRVFFHLKRRLYNLRKIRNLTREFHVKFYLKKRCCTQRFAIRGISLFRVKFNVEFPCEVMNFPIEFWFYFVLTLVSNEEINQTLIKVRNTSKFV